MSLVLGLCKLESRHWRHVSMDSLDGFQRQPSAASHPHIPIRPPKASSTRSPSWLLLQKKTRRSGARRRPQVLFSSSRFGQVRLFSHQTLLHGLRLQPQITNSTIPKPEITNAPNQRIRACDDLRLVKHVLRASGPEP